MKRSETDKKMNESKKPKTETESKIIGTSELSIIVSERIGRNIEPKRLRSILRNDNILSETFDDGNYTKYRFRFPSNVTDKIIGRLIEIENGRNVKRSESIKRKTERKTKTENVLIGIDDNGKPLYEKPISEMVESDKTKTETESK